MTIKNMFNKRNFVFVAAFAFLALASIALLTAAPPEEGVEGEVFNRTGGVTVVADDATASGSQYAQFPVPIVEPPPGDDCDLGVVNPSLAIDFSSINPPFERNGTYYSTLGAPSEALRWMCSENLIWNKPLPANTPLDSRSSDKIRELAEIARGNWSNIQYGGGWPAFIEDTENASYTILADSDRSNMQYVKQDCRPWGGAEWNGWSATSYSVDRQNNYFNGTYSDKVGIPLPSDLNMSLVDRGGDFPVIVYDYRDDTIFDFWRMWTSNLSGAYHSGPIGCSAGVIKGFAEQASGVYPYPRGADAAGMTGLGPMITLKDLERGYINHALSISIPQVSGTGQNTLTFSYPATRSDDWCGDQITSAMGQSIASDVGGTQNCIREGQYIRLPAGYDTSGIAHPVARMMADAIRDYGMVVHDHGGGAGIQGESGLATIDGGFTTVNPWSIAYAAGAGNPATLLPWEDMQLVAENFGQPSGYLKPCDVDWVNEVIGGINQNCQRAVPWYEPI